MKAAAEFFEDCTFWLGRRGWDTVVVERRTDETVMKSVKRPGVKAALCRKAFSVTAAAMRACMRVERG